MGGWHTVKVLNISILWVISWFSVRSYCFYSTSIFVHSRFACTLSNVIQHQEAIFFQYQINLAEPSDAFLATISFSLRHFHCVRRDHTNGDFTVQLPIMDVKLTLHK